MTDAPPPNPEPAPEPQPFVRYARSDAQAILATLADHGARGVPIPENLMKAATATAATLLGSQNDRMRARGMDFVLGAAALNLKLYVEADRMARLDGGMPTERTEVKNDAPLDVMALAAKDPKVMRAIMDAIDREEGVEPRPGP